MSSLSFVSLLLTAMAIITEVRDDEDDPNKKPQETMLPQLPNDVIDIIIAMLPRTRYPKFSLLSKYFHRLTTSSRLYQERLSRNVTESLLYGLVGFLPLFEFPRWYILHRNNQLSPLRLSIIGSLPPMPYGSAVVTLGHYIYVLGGSAVVTLGGQDVYRKRTRRVILIDCRTHTWRLLPSMLGVRYLAAAGVIDGKIYVIGGREKWYPHWVEVFDVKTESWSTVPAGPYDIGHMKGEFEAYVVINDKIYLLDCETCFSYDPRNHRWELCQRLRDFWRGSSCVVDDMLYTIDTTRNFESYVIVYDPEEEDWRPVNGVRGFCSLLYNDSKMANYGGKLVVLVVGAPNSQCMGCEKNIWCIEIALKRRKDGEISGKLESATGVLASMNLPTIQICRTVTM